MPSWSSGLREPLQHLHLPLLKVKEPSPILHLTRHSSPPPSPLGLEAPKFDLHGLEYVYSQEHLSLHDLEYISPVEKGAHLKRRQLQETTTEERSLHIACCEYQKATEYEKFLKLQLGANNIYPAYVGESAGTVCFALFTTPSAASAVQEIPSTR